MSEEFGTVNLKRSESREIDLLRRHYRAHRESLAGLLVDAPSASLANEYQRLIGEIDRALLKLDDLEGKKPPINLETNPSLHTSPGTRPLVRASEPGTTPVAGSVPAGGGEMRSRIAIIIVAAVVVLAIIGWLIWRASSERKTAAAPVTEQPITTTSAVPPPAVTPAPAPPAPALTVTPAAADYGVIRKGTRAVRQFEVANGGSTPLDIAIARSACRCLYYDYNSKLPAKGKGSITVTIDGARAKPGVLQEELTVEAKKDPSLKATFLVRATIR